MRKFEERGLGIDFKEGITFKDIEEERDLYTLDQKRIEKKFNSKKAPNFRLFANYLNKKYIEGFMELDKKEIMKDLKISMGTINLYLCELNRFEKFQPIRWISINGKKDFIEVAGKDFRNSHNWIKKNLKGSISKTARVYQTTEKVKFLEEEKALKEFRKKQMVKLLNLKKHKKREDESQMS